MFGEFVKSNINNSINSSKECVLSRLAKLNNNTIQTAGSDAKFADAKAEEDEAYIDIYNFKIESYPATYESADIFFNDIQLTSNIENNENNDEGMIRTKIKNSENKNNFPLLLLH